MSAHSYVGTLRQRLRSGELIVAPGIYDPFTGLLIEELGFGAVYLGGNALGLQLGVGQPFVTLTETADAVYRVGRVVKLPLIVDGGAGFGDAAHSVNAINALVHAGASAVHIDDQIYPKRAHYHKGQGRLAEMKLVAGKLEAMRTAQEKSVILIARTDALRVTGSIAEAVERCRVFAEAGAEAVMVLDLGIEEAHVLRDSLPETPLVWIGGIHEPVPTVQQLQNAGFAMALYPFNTVGAISEAVKATWADMSHSGRPALPQKPAGQTVKAALETIDMDTMWQIESRSTEMSSAQQGD